jgi:hypothetical protein
MRRTETTVNGRISTPTRIAWWAFFAVPLALLFVLLVARPAMALTVEAGPFAVSSPSPSANEENEGEEESEATEEEEEEEEEEGGSPPTECLLQTARVQAFAYPAQNRLRLAIHYTATEPTKATVSYRFSGGKGPLRFAQSKQHLGQAGSIRLSDKLSASEASKVTAAGDFTVEIRIPGTPASCRSFDTRHLTIEHGGGDRLTWFQVESARGA